MIRLGFLDPSPGVEHVTLNSSDHVEAGVVPLSCLSIVGVASSPGTRQSVSGLVAFPVFRCEAKARGNGGGGSMGLNPANRINNSAVQVQKGPKIPMALGACARAGK